MFLTIADVQNIVNAMIKESEINDDYRALALSDVEEAIKLIIYRDFPPDVQMRYHHTLKYF